MPRLLLFLTFLSGILTAGWQECGYGKWTVTGFENTPFPDSSLSGPAFNDNSVFIFIPAGFIPDLKIHLIVDHHGHGAIIDPGNPEKISYPEIHRQAYQLYESRKNAVLIIPQAARNQPSSSAGRFSRPTMFVRFIDEICNFLKTESIVPGDAELGQIHLNSFSGGYLITAMDLHVNPPEFTRHIRSVHLWDSFYGAEHIYYDWIKQQKGYFFNTFTPAGGTRQLSVQMTDSLAKLGIPFSTMFPDTGALPRVIIEATDKSHRNVSRGEFSYERYLKALPLPDIDITVPEPLSCLAGNSSITVTWKPVKNDHLAGFRLWGSGDTNSWQLLADETRLGAGMCSYADERQDRCFYKLQSVGTTGQVITSPLILSARPFSENDHILIVHAENRRLNAGVRGFNSDDFLYQPDEALFIRPALYVDGRYSSCSNHAIQSRLIDSADFDHIFWISGNETAQAKTVDAAEKTWLRAFLEQGGNLLISGNSIAEEFGSSGAGNNDLDFGEQILGIAGQDSVSTAPVLIWQDTTFALKPRPGGYSTFSRAIRPMLTDTAGHFFGAYVKRSRSGRTPTVLSLTFSLSDIESDRVIHQLVQLFPDLVRNAPLTPEPPPLLNSIAFNGGELVIGGGRPPDSVIVTLYDQNRMVTGRDTIPGKNALSLAQKNPVFFRIQGLSGKLAGTLSVLIGGSVGTNKKNVLIVDGFERRTEMNQRDYVLEHALSWGELGYDVASATNQALIDHLIDPRSFDMMDWILGEESTVDRTFIPQEQELVRDYISGGGRLIVSGSEIGWDLQARARSASDSLFLHEIFGARFRDDNAGTNFCLPVSASFDPDTIFFGKTYPVDYPDVFEALGNAEVLLNYPGGGAAALGKHFENGGSAVIAGFPLESVQAPQTRLTIFRLFIQFLEGSQ